MKPTTLYLSAVGRPGPGDTVVVDVQLSSRLQPKPGMPVHERLHSHASVVLDRAARGEKTVAFAPPTEVTVDDRAIYRVFFHGPTYRVLEGVRLEDGHVVGIMRRGLPPNAREAGAAELVVPRLIELCFQTAGVFDISRRKAFGLPAGLESLRLYRPAELEGDRFFAEVWPREGSRGFDAHVVDSSGNVRLELSGYHTVTLPDAKTLAELHESVAEGALA